MHPAHADTPSPTPHTPGPAPAGHAPRADSTWDLARRDYLDGDSRSQVCDRYGLSPSTFADRAKREGWRRCDQPDPAPDPDDDPEADEPVDCAALAGEALIRLRRGRAAEAASWMRLHDKLTARLEAGRQAAARRARVARGRGSDAAAGGLEPLRERLAVIGTLSATHVRLGRAWALGHISTPSFEALSAINEDALRTLALSDAAAADMDDADSSDSSDSVFSAAPDP